MEGMKIELRDAAESHVTPVVSSPSKIDDECDSLDFDLPSRIAAAPPPRFGTPISLREAREIALSAIARNERLRQEDRARDARWMALSSSSDDTGIA